MQRLLLFLLSVFFIACANDQTSDEPDTNGFNILPKHTTEKAVIPNPQDAKPKEKTKSPSIKTVSEFPGVAYEKVVLYELDGRGNHSGAKSVFRQQTGGTKVLTEKDVQAFLKLISTPKSYGNTTAACHEPRIGLVFYNEQEEEVAYLSLCLACNNVYTSPVLAFSESLIPKHGFSIKSRKQLHKIFEEWGFPDEEFSPLFDDGELYEAFLIKKGVPKSEIKEAIKEHKETYGH